MSFRTHTCTTLKGLKSEFKAVFLRKRLQRSLDSNKSLRMPSGSESANWKSYIWIKSLFGFGFQTYSLCNHSSPRGWINRTTDATSSPTLAEKLVFGMLPSLSQSPKWCGRAFGHVSKRAWTASVFKARNRREKGKLSKDVTNATTTHSNTFSVPRCLPEMRHSWQNHSSQNTRIGSWDSTEIQTLPKNIKNKTQKG